GIELVERVENLFDFLEARIKRAKELRYIFGAHTLAVLSPKHAAIFAREGDHGIADPAHERGMFGAREIERRAHMQHAGIDMAEHAVGKAFPVEQGPEFPDIGSEVFRWDGRVLDEGDRPCRTVH